MDIFTNGRDGAGLREEMHVVAIYGLKNNKEISAGLPAAAPEVTTYEALPHLRSRRIALMKDL